MNYYISIEFDMILSQANEIKNYYTNPDYDGASIIFNE